MSQALEKIKEDISTTVNIYLQRTGQKGYFDNDLGVYIIKEKEDKTSEDEKEVLLSFLYENITNLLNSKLASNEYLIGLSEYKDYCFQSIGLGQTDDNFSNEDLYNHLNQKLSEIKKDDEIIFEWCEHNLSNFFKNNGTYREIKEAKISFLKEKLSELENDTSLNYLDQEGNLHSLNLSERIIDALEHSCEQYKAQSHYESEELDSLFDPEIPDNSDFDIDLKYSAKNEILKLFERFQKASLNDDFYSNVSPYSVYESHYHKRLQNFKEENVDAGEIDFIKKDVKLINEWHTLPLKNRLPFELPNIEELNQKIEFSKKKKLQFLEDKLSKLGLSLQIAFYEDQGYRYFCFEDNESEPEHPSFSKKAEKNKYENKENQLTANQAIILLDKIGFFSDSQIESLSKNKQSEIVSKLIGKDKKNISDYIGKLEYKQTTNAYNKDIEKVDNLLKQ